MLPANVIRMLELARRVSLRSPYPRIHIGAVVARKARVLGVGFNQRKTHPRSPSPYRHLHAEIDAVMGVPLTELRGAVVYVYRSLPSGLPGMSRPCADCERYLQGCGVKTVYYTRDTGYGSIALKEIPEHGKR